MTLKLLRELEERLTAAERSANRTAMERLLANDFSGINPQGQPIDKAGFIAGMCNPDLKFDRLEVTETSLKIVASVGIAMGKTEYRGTFRQHPVEGMTRFMDVWDLSSENGQLLSSMVMPHIPANSHR